MQNQGLTFVLAPVLDRWPFTRAAKERLRISPLGCRLVQGALWTIVAAVVTRALGLLSAIITARLLGRTAFGEFGMIQSTAGLFGALAGLGIGITATKYVAELRELAPDRCGRVIGFALATAAAGGVLAGVALVLLGPWLAAHLLAAPHLAPLLRCGAGLVVFGALQGVYLGALAGFEAFKRMAWVSWISSMLGVPLVVVGTLVAGLEGAVWGTVLQMAVGCVLGHAALAKEATKAGVSLGLAVGHEEWSLLWRFTLPALLGSMVAGPTGWLSRTFLVNQAGGYAELGLVSAANQWMNLANFLPWVMGGTLAPILSNLHAAGRRAEFVKLLRYSLLLSAGASLALALPLILTASKILALYGPDFSEGVPIFTVTMVAGAFIAVNHLLSRAMQSAGQAWLDLAANGLWAVAVLTGSWLLVRDYRALGLVAAHALAALALALWQWLIAHRLLARRRAARAQPA
jgi:O-antigen/teichoic acid export membrane protein